MGESVHKKKKKRIRGKLQEKIKAVNRFLKLRGRGGITGTEASEDHVPTQGRLTRMEPRQAVESWQGLKFQAPGSADTGKRCTKKDWTTLWSWL